MNTQDRTWLAHVSAQERGSPQSLSWDLRGIRSKATSFPHLLPWALCGARRTAVGMGTFSVGTPATGAPVEKTKDIVPWNRKAGLCTASNIM